MYERLYRGKSLLVVESMKLFESFARAFVDQELMKLTFIPEDRYPVKVEGLSALAAGGKYDFIAIHPPKVASQEIAKFQLEQILLLDKRRAIIMLQEPISQAEIFLHEQVAAAFFNVVGKASYRGILEAMSLLSNL